MIWGRREEYTNLFFEDKIIIHGHTPISEEACKQLVQGKSQVINIDTGCVYVDRGVCGCLSALELHSMQLFTVSFPMLFKESDFEKSKIDSGEFFITVVYFRIYKLKACNINRRPL